MEKIYGRTWPIVSVRVSGISYSHLTNSALVNTRGKLLLNLVLMSRKRAAGIFGWYWACAHIWVFTSSAVSIKIMGSKTARCFYGEPHRTVGKISHFSNRILTASHSIMGATFWHWRKYEVLAYVFGMLLSSSVPHRLTTSAAYEFVEMERSGNRKMFNVLSIRLPKSHGLGVDSITEYR